METVQSVINWLLTAPFGVLITALVAIYFVNYLIHKFKLGIKQDGKLSSTVFISACSILIVFNISLSQYDVLTTLKNWTTQSAVGILFTVLAVTFLIRFVLGLLKPEKDYGDHLTVFFYVIAPLWGFYSFSISEKDATSWFMYMLGTIGALDLLLVASVGSIAVVLVCTVISDCLPHGWCKELLSVEFLAVPVWVTSLLLVSFVNMSYPLYLFEKHALAQIEKRPWMQAVNYSYIEGKLLEPMSWYRPVLHSVSMVMPVVREGAKELQWSEYIFTTLTFNKHQPNIFVQAHCKSGEVIYHHQTEGEKKLQRKGQMTKSEMALYCHYDWSAKLSLFEEAQKPKIMRRLSAS
ncbi:hypothetical protein [Photobacterium kasasachensis]|uniref:hypothetical protein n=1 Tax=Photobacterium kasasachensis TaxID=2910240 RepID=UPI003D102819